MEHLHVAGENTKWWHFWKTVWSFFLRLSIKLPYDSAIPFLSVYPREMKMNVHTKTYVFSVHSNVIHNSQIVEKSKRTPIVEWINEILQSIGYILYEIKILC